jgi:hypothetical protein
MEAVSTIVVILIMVGVPVFLLGTMIRSIRRERRRSNLARTWRNFGLSIVLSVLFLVSWLGQALSEWQVFVDEQRSHGEPVAVVDYLVRFGQSTMENWQSEFLQLFSFVVLAAILIHRGSAESRDAGDRMEAALQRIQAQLEQLGADRSEV